MTARFNATRLGSRTAPEGAVMTVGTCCWWASTAAGIADSATPLAGRPDWKDNTMTVAPVLVTGAAGGTTRWKLIDRRAEFGAIRSVLTSHERFGVFLAGPAGVGKTTLARTITKSLPWKVHWVACTESSRSIPLGIFAHLVSPSTSLDPVTLMASARKSLIAHDNTVIAVDDAYLLDPLSAAVLHQIAVDRAAHILATVRSGEPVADAVTALWKDGHLQRFELEPFTKEQSIALVESVIGGTLEGLSADVIWQSSGGNPLFLRHLVEGAIDAGTLTKVNDVWQLRGATVVPAGLAALLDDRLDQAGNDVINALKPLALCEPLDIDALSELVGENAVDAAEMRGLIRIVHNGPQINARFSHPLFGEVVRRRIGTASARKLRGRIAEVLPAGQLDSAAGRIQMAQLYVDSDLAAEPDLLIAAAKDAIPLSNLPQGERLARAALARGGGLPAAALLSRALVWQGHPVQAEEILGRFEPDNLDELQLVQWGIGRLSILFWFLGDAGRAHDVLALLRDRVRHPSLTLVVEAVGSAMAVLENKIAEGVAAATRVLSDPHAHEVELAEVEYAAFAVGLAMVVAGRGHNFEPIAARYRAEPKASEGVVRSMVRYCDVLALIQPGQLDRADKRAADYAVFSSAGQFLGWAIAKIMAGHVAVYGGKFPDAILSIEQSVAAFAQASPLWLLPARVLLARAYAALGRADEADRVLADAEKHKFFALFGPQVMMAKSWVAATKGLERSAVELARAAADAAHESGQYAVEAEALHDAARFGDRTVAQRLAELVDRVDGDMVVLQARHAAAIASSDGPALDAVSAHFEDVGLLLSAADSAAQAAPLHHRASQRRRSLESAARALRLAELCGGAVTPAIRAAAQPLPVTSREREIALLVAAGLSNREIAERLTLSVRTVEGHVYRARFKLDAADRDELAKVMRHEMAA
jgi:DNA-binding CsgD family transcriptional regulator